MTYRCQWETREDDGVRDFATEAAAETFAAELVRRGHGRVVVFEVGEVEAL